MESPEQNRDQWRRFIEAGKERIRQAEELVESDPELALELVMNQLVAMTRASKTKA